MVTCWSWKQLSLQVNQCCIAPTENNYNTLVWQVTLRLIIINKSTNGQRLKDSIYYFLSSNLLSSIPNLIYRPANCDHPWTNYVWWSLLWTIRVFFLISHYQTGFFLKHWIAKNGGNTNLSKIQRTTGRRNHEAATIK